jgi:hypothetical protein
VGAVEIFVPDGVEVRLTGRAILGEKLSTVRQAPVPGAPVVEVRARVILGSVKVQPPGTPSGSARAPRRV